MNNGVNNNIQQPTVQSVNGVGQSLQPQMPPMPQQSQPTLEKQKKTINISLILIFIILLLAGFSIYSYLNYKSEIARLNYECSPVKAMEEVKLDLNSTLVKDLYNKVYTNIREDIAQFNLTDELKLYLAFKQIPSDKFYDSNCNLFDQTSMKLYSCTTGGDFVPKAFKEESLQLEVKKLFGEKVTLENKNIQLGGICLGGYQYIAERGEYVEGNCGEYNSTIYRADKKLVEAVSTQNTIKLKEEVRYYGNEKNPIPDYLKSGDYIYTFRLDTNYNYVYVNKEYVEKY